MGIEEQLQVGERILYRATPNPLPLLPPAALAVVAGAGALVLRQLAKTHPTASWLALAGAALALVALGVAGIRYLTLSSRIYAVTDRRVIRQVGILSKLSTDAALDKINNVEMRQPLLGRLLGFGDVEVDTASEVGSTVFPQIRHPAEFKRAVLSAAEAYRGRSRMAAVPTATVGVEQIRQLKQLLDEGLVSREEYEAKRKRLLDEV
jgi:uncharacterized membrane protein YdbT with pleckstrin-like domain